MVFSIDEIRNKMEDIPEWGLDEEERTIETEFEFEDFVEAIEFVKKVAAIAEGEDHHPDIDIRYNKVRLKLTTHSEGRLTEKDFNVAKEINAILE